MSILLEYPLLPESSSTPSLWVGLNNGTIYAYSLELPSAELTDGGNSVKAVLSKEIHLRHGAPVIFLAMLDNAKLKSSMAVDTPVGFSAPSSPVPSTSAVLPVVVVEEAVTSSPPVSPLPATPTNTPIQGVATTNGHGGASVQKLLVATEERLKVTFLFFDNYSFIVGFCGAETDSFNAFLIDHSID